MAKQCKYLSECKEDQFFIRHFNLIGFCSKRNASVSASVCLGCKYKEIKKKVRRLRDC